MTQSFLQLLTRWQTAVSGTNLTQPPAYTGPNYQLPNITDHTREVVEGSGFVARVGLTSDAHTFIGQAIKHGAKLIFGERDLAELDVTLPADVTYLQTENSSELYAWLMAAWYNFPSHQLVMIGVTGTDGKTTTVNFLHQMLTSAGIKAGMLSTLKAMIGDTEEPLALHVTTPEAPVIQRYLRRMVDEGVTHCILETTSHSLAQHRVTAVDYDIAVVTNITHEHLDYHGSHEAYVAAKMRLFNNVAHSDLQKNIPHAVPKTIIVNADDPISANHLGQLSFDRKIHYGLEHNPAKLDIFADEIALHPWSTQFNVSLFGESLPVQTKMFGLFNIYNILAATAACSQLGLSHTQIQTGIANLSQLYGRMQLIDKGQPFLVIVDFAHTPNSLEKAIETARKTLQSTGKENGRIITVFGSAGLRDPEKRSLMAHSSATQADLTILTAEDPRTESLDAILETMANAANVAGGVEGTTFWRIPDRGQAIYFSLTQAQPNDLLLICGKGHEQSMCFGTTELPWDDVKATKTALEAFLANQPMPDLGLPTFDKDWGLGIRD